MNKERRNKVGLENTRQRKGVRTGGEGLWACMRLWPIFRVQRRLHRVTEGERGSGEKDWEGKEHAVLHV